MRAQLPYARAGQVIGLLGGSFDPAHGGHVHITKSALKRFGLDRVWWLVSPGNPLKARGPAPLAQRVAHARQLARNPRITVTDIEARIGTRYTAETLQALGRLYPGVTFVWLMGADNLAQFDQWDNWHWIINNVPIGVMARPGDRMAARHAKAAEIYRYAQVRGRASHSLAWGPAPRWSFINIPMNNSSSTAIRAKGDWT